MWYQVCALELEQGAVDRSDLPKPCSPAVCQQSHCQRVTDRKERGEPRL